MKDIKNFIINENKTKVITFDDVVDFTGSSDNTLTNGSICIGAEGQKHNPKYWDESYNDEYEEFVKAYKAAGGKIKEETANQGMHEVFCNYAGNNEATKYILSAFCRLVFGKYVK